MSQDSQHARISPSKLERIMLCPGSVPLAEEFSVPETSRYAEEGTLLHSYISEMIDAYPDKLRFPKTTTEQMQILDWAFSEVIELWNYVTRTGDANSAGTTILIDHPITMPEPCFEVQGTLDFAVYHCGAMHVVDFKFGAGIEVFARDNSQLLAYLAGAMKHAEVKSNCRPQEMFVHIIQPRLEKHDVEQIFPEDLEHFQARVEKAIRLANSKNPPIHPGSVQCKWCPAAGACKARAKDTQANAALALEAFADVDDNRSKILTVDELAKIYAQRKNVEAGFTAIGNFLLSQLQLGAEVPGFKLVNGRATRKWRHDVDECVLSDATGIDEMDLLVTTLKSPAQVEKLLPKKRHQELKEFIDVVEGPPSIAAVSSPKAAIDPSDTLTAFADAEEKPSNAKYYLP